MNIGSIEAVSKLQEVNTISMFLARDAVKLLDSSNGASPEELEKLTQVVEKLIKAAQDLKSLIPATK